VKKLGVIVILLLTHLVILAQTYGNEWIKYNQAYAKFPINREGLYRIDSATLAQRFNLSTLNPKNLQLFLRGKEQTLFIQGEGDNKFNTNDFIEFYADVKIAEIDSLIYAKINNVPNPYSGLFSDTIYAFLTFNNSFNNKRYTIETDTTASLYPSLPYVYTEALSAYTGWYNFWPLDPNLTCDPAYNNVEGRGLYISSVPGNPSSLSSNFSLLNPYITSSVSLPAYIRYSGSGFNNGAIPIDHRVLVSYRDLNNVSIQLNDFSFKGFVPFNTTHTVDVNTLGQNSNFTFSVGALAVHNFSQFTMINYVSMLYPRTLNLSNKTYFKFTSQDVNASSKNFFNFNNFGLTNSSAVILYDLGNNLRINTKINGSNVRAVIPNGSLLKTCVMAGDSSFIKVKKIFSAGKNGYYTKYNANPANKPFVMVYHPTLSVGSNSYAAYRQTLQGGAYQVIKEDINLLYEQFSYGVPKHPMAMKNFFRFLNDSLSSKPLYVLLIGKGMNYWDMRTTTAAAQNQNLIPTFGFGSADVMLTAAISKNNKEIYLPEIPIGRIAATNNNDLGYYLNKVVEFESIDTAAWKKKILHFVGGDDDALNKTLGRYMDNMANIIKDTLFGARVYTFIKNTTSPIQTNMNDSVYRILNEGASIMNFFGHGSASGFDQNINDETKMNNRFKYPFLVGNSCNAGDIYLPNFKSFSENYLFLDKKGSIGFLSPVGFGIDVYLNEYSTNFYKALCGNKYGLGVGDAIKEAIFQTNKIDNSILRYLTVTIALHGDPSIKFFPGAKPDYILKNYNVNFDSKKYTDSIGIQIITINSGKAIRDTLGIKIRRFFPNGDTVTVIKKVRATLNRDTLLFYMAIDFRRGFGLNEFDVNIDYQNKISELNENNNATVGKISLFIPGGDIFPVYPFKYAVVPKTNKIILKASTTDPFSPNYTYRFQLDTCDQFINPINSALISSRGGVVEWEVNLPFADSTVYFWRVSKDSTANSNYFNWRETSFQTIGDKRGWSQSHFHQFKSNTFKHLDYKKAARLFAYDNVLRSIETINFNARSDAEAGGITYFLDGSKMDDFSCTFAGWNFAIFDSISTEVEEVKSVNYPAAGFSQVNSCISFANQIRKVYMFGAAGGGDFPCPSANWKTHVENFLNSIPTGKYVLGYSTSYFNINYSPRYSTYSNSLYKAFESIGASKIRTIKDTLTYTIFGRKGLPIGQAHETIGLNRSAETKQKDSIQSKWSTGFMTSEIIGPSYKWNSLHWSVKSLDTKKGDSTLIKIIGLNGYGRVDTLATFSKDSLNIKALYNYVNANTYPFIKLVAVLKDNKNLTPPQLKYWQVLYDEAPECAINPLKGFASINDTLAEGDKVTFRFPIENIGVKEFKDSLRITYWIEDKQNNKISLPQKHTRKPFQPGEVIIDTIVVNSNNLLGENAFWINVNPVNQLKYQQEQYQFNNIGRFPFNVSKDITNPLLDVTFDGQRILNGDIVSAKPNILVSLKDENKFLALNDTSAFNLALKAPNQNSAQPVYFAKELEFRPAIMPNNSASILYNPNLTVDGKYTLFVKAKDRSNNLSGSKDYQVDFEVNNKPSITGVLNYPNPFSSATKFVFTLTGSEIPEVFTIQIMTISGKIVREITRAELGNLRIGRNITDYAWDGKDNYGDKLANGVYLYRVVTKLNGQSIEKNASGADQFIFKDFGKMVIMR
jgi:hypothetical protein